MFSKVPMSDNFERKESQQPIRQCILNQGNMYIPFKTIIHWEVTELCPIEIRLNNTVTDFFTTLL